MVFQVFTIINLLAVTSQFSTRPTTTSIATPLHSAEENGPSRPPAGIWDEPRAEVLLSDHRWQCCFNYKIVNFGRFWENKVKCSNEIFVLKSSTYFCHIGIIISQGKTTLNLMPCFNPTNVDKQNHV